LGSEPWEGAALGTGGDGGNGRGLGGVGGGGVVRLGDA
jgi:hypothetical protein